MPFTFCHPALVLPLTKFSKSTFSATGLIIGSMAPDFEYFLKMRMEKIHGHSFWGVFYFDLPLTILLAFIFHLFVRDALIVNLPELLKKRLKPFVGYNWLGWVKRRWYVLIYSALVGILSHLFWDAFTHTNGYFVQRIALLQGSVDIFGVIMRKADFLQALSTVVGGLIIFLALIWPQKNDINGEALRQKIIYWSCVVLILAVIIFIRNIQNLGDFVATFISGGLIGLTITPYILSRFNQKNNAT